MFSRKISQVQFGAWLFVSMTAPIAQIASGISWTVVLLLGAVCLLACWFVNRMHREDMGWSPWLCVAECIWLIVVLGAVCRDASGSWPVENAYPAVPIVLLILAALSADGERTSRVGSVLLWLVVPVYVILICAGAGDLESVDVKVSFNAKTTDMALAFLIPALAVFLPIKKKGVFWKTLVGILGFGLVISVLVIGNLSRQVAENAEYPFFEWVRGLRFLGKARRLEAVVSVALTLGWFSLLSLLLSAFAYLAERIRTGFGRKGVWIAAGVAVGTTFLGVYVPRNVVAVGSFILWVLLPLVMILFVRKSEKTLN